MLRGTGGCYARRCLQSVHGGPAPLTHTLEPLDDHLIIEPTEEDVETRTGLIIPRAPRPCRTGIVTAVGSDALGIDPGDKVLFPKDAATTSASAAWSAGPSAGRADRPVHD